MKIPEERFLFGIEGGFSKNRLRLEKKQPPSLYDLSGILKEIAPHQNFDTLYN